MIEAARLKGVERYLYTSSACIYPGYRQQSADVTPLKEEDAYPADPEDGYGWEKLYSERQCRHYFEDYGLETRVVRFHNIFGPLGTYDGGREKSPAAICRKVALAEDGDEIEVWGDGQQTRSYCYIDDCVEGIYRLMRSDFREPLNLGQDRLITSTSWWTSSRGGGKRIGKRHDLSAPQGVRGRNSDNTRLREVLGWEPAVSLEDGLGRTYRWIEEQLGSGRRRRSGDSTWSGSRFQQRRDHARRGSPAPPAVDILGVEVSATTMDRTLAVIERWIAGRQPAMSA